MALAAAVGATDAPSHRQALLREAYRRGILDTGQTALYEEGVRRGLFKDPYAQARLELRQANATPNQTAAHLARQSGNPQEDALWNRQTGNGVTFGFLPELQGAVNAGVVGAQDLGGRVGIAQRQPYSMGQAYEAGRDETRAEIRLDQAQHPKTSLFGNLMGAGFTAPAGSEYVLAGRTLPAMVLRGMGLGGVEGAVAGAGNAGPGHRVQGAAYGGVAGAAVGAVAPVVGAGLGKLVGAGASAAQRVVNRATGGRILQPTAEAARRLIAALKQDGATPEQLRVAANGFLKNGAADPTLLDVASRLPSGGVNTRALIRGASMTGEGRGAATQYADQVTADLQDRALAHTARLTPSEARPAAAVQAGMREAQGAQADGQYRVPYQTPVPVTDEIAGAIADAPGVTAIKRAQQAAIARQDYDQARRLGSLIAPDVSSLPANTAAKVQAALRAQNPDVTAGDLDRVRIALGNMGRQRLQNPETRDIAAGLFGRQAQLSEALDGVPQLAEARGAYKAAQANIDAIDHGATGLNAAPDEFAAGLAGAAPEARAAAGVGYRQTLADAIGNPAEGSTGILNRVSTSTNQGRNLAETFGQDAADTYRGGLTDLRDQLGNARYVSPDTGSQTAGRLVDTEAASRLPTWKPHELVGLAINKIMRGVTLTDAERAAIAQIGLSPMTPRLPSEMIPPPFRPGVSPYVTAIGAPAAGRIAGGQ